MLHRGMLGCAIGLTGRPVVRQRSGATMSQSARNRGGASPGGKAPVVIKKYANRRLYNTETSSYITLDDLAGLVRAGDELVVLDARTNDDITRGVLTQVIVEAEAKGGHLLSTAFLRQLIGFHGDAAQAAVPRFLEQALAAFARQQDRATIERAINLFAPFRPAGPPPREGSRAEAELAALRAELENLRRELAEARQTAASGHR